MIQTAKKSLIQLKNILISLDIDSTLKVMLKKKHSKIILNLHNVTKTNFS